MRSALTLALVGVGWCLPAAVQGPPPEPERLEISAVSEVRDLRELSEAGRSIYVWDAGAEVSLLIGRATAAPTAWIEMDGEVLPVALRTVRGVHHDHVRLELGLPSQLGRGTLEIADGTARIQISLELWRPQEELLRRFDDKGEISAARTSTVDAWAMAAEVFKFRAALAAGEREAAEAAASRWEESARARSLRYSENRARTIRSYVALTAGRTQDAARRALLGAVRAERQPLIASEWASARHHLANAFMATLAGAAAVQSLKEGAEVCRQLGLQALESLLEGERATALARLGRFEEALEVVQAARVEDEMKLTQIEGDIYLRRWEARRDFASFEAAAAALQTSMRLARARGELDLEKERSVELAWAFARRGDADRARSFLGTNIEGIGRGGVIGLPTLTLAQLDLLEGRPRAAADRLEPLVEAPPSRWDKMDLLVEVEGQELLAEAYMALGRTGDAATALETALRHAQRAVESTRTSMRPQALLQRRAHLRHLTVSALAEVGLVERALLLDDQHRRLVLHRLARPAAAQHELADAAEEVRRLLRADSVEELRTLDALMQRFGVSPASAFALPSHEKILATTEALQERLRPSEAIWVGPFHSGGQGIEVRRDHVRVQRGEPTADDLTHVYVVTERLEDAVGWARSLARRARGPTASVIPYATWLLRPRRGLGRGAVIVADPERDLPSARLEGYYVASQWNTSATWIGRGPPSVDRLIEAIDGADLFHFAGHGEVSTPDPWRTQLRLGTGAKLTVGDWVKASPSVRLVVLDGCWTSGGSARAGEVSFPQAMLESGVSSVLATMRPVMDSVASRFIADFYAAGGAKKPRVGWRAAILASDQRADGASGAFILWGR